MPRAISLGQNFSVFNNQTAGQTPPKGVTRHGSIEVTWVRSPIDGEGLFQIAAQTVIDRSHLGQDDLPVEIRAQSIEAQLRIEIGRFEKNVVEQLKNQFWHTNRSTPRSAKVIISTLNNRPILQIKSSDRSRPFSIVTVTQPDIDFYSETPDLLSEEWQDILQDEVIQIEQLFSLETARQGLQRSFIILLGMIIITGICVFLHWWLWQRRRTLQKKAEAEVNSGNSAQSLNETRSQSDGDSQSVGISSSVNAHLVDEPNPSIILSGLLADRSGFLRILHRQPTLERQFNTLKFFQWLLVWLVIFAWYSGLIGLTYTLPMLTLWRNKLLSQPFKLLSIWFMVNVALRTNRIITRRVTKIQQDISTAHSSEEQRKALRTNTVGRVLEGFVVGIVGLTGLLLTLSTFGIPAGSVLAWGAVLGLAVSFGTQSLIKDVVNGSLILLEDQFAVGDVISVNNMYGFVEEMSLRSTRLRDPEGQLITIPNRRIAEVRNLTRLWSRVDFTVEVAYDNNPDKVLMLLSEIAQRMYVMPEWREKMISPPEVLGIDHLSHSGILIRVWLKTVPLQQWAVGREYRLRVRRAFEANGITIGKPQWISHNTSLEQSSIHDAL